MNLCKSERLAFWQRAEVAAKQRLDETRLDLSSERNTMRKEVLSRIISDDVARVKIAQDFIFMLQPRKGDNLFAE